MIELVTSHKTIHIIPARFVSCAHDSYEGAVRQFAAVSVHGNE